MAAGDRFRHHRHRALIDLGLAEVDEAEVQLLGQDGEHRALGDEVFLDEKTDQGLLLLRGGKAGAVELFRSEKPARQQQLVKLPP